MLSVCVNVMPCIYKSHCAVLFQPHKTVLNQIWRLCGSKTIEEDKLDIKHATQQGFTFLEVMKGQIVAILSQTSTCKQILGNK